MKVSTQFHFPFIFSETNKMHFYPRTPYISDMSNRVLSYDFWLEKKIRISSGYLIGHFHRLNFRTPHSCYKYWFLWMVSKQTFLELNYVLRKIFCKVNNFHKLFIGKLWTLQQLCKFSDSQIRFWIIFYLVLF